MICLTPSIRPACSSVGFEGRAGHVLSFSTGSKLNLLLVVKIKREKMHWNGADIRIFVAQVVVAQSLAGRRVQQCRASSWGRCILCWVNCHRKYFLWHHISVLLALGWIHRRENDQLKQVLLGEKEQSEGWNGSPALHCSWKKDKEFCKCPEFSLVQDKKLKLGIKLRLASALLSVLWPLSLWRGRTHHKLPQFTFCRFPRYSLVSEPEREDKQLGGLHADRLCWDSNPDPRSHT